MRAATSMRRSPSRILEFWDSDPRPSPQVLALPESYHSTVRALNRYESQLSGAPPQLSAQGGVSSPRVSVELHAIGGTCGLALELPARQLDN